MKNKKTFKFWTYKFLMTLKGWGMKQRFKHGRYYISPYIPDKRYMYNNKNEFFCAFAANVAPGVGYQSQYRVTFKNWELGILKFKEN